MICPNCAHDQADAAECQRCGIVIARFKGHGQRAPIASEPAEPVAVKPVSAPVKPASEKAFPSKVSSEHSATRQAKQGKATQAAPETKTSALVILLEMLGSFVRKQPPSLRLRARVWQNLGRLLGAGVPLPESLRSVQDIAGKGYFADSLGQLAEQMERGQLASLSAGLAQQPTLFEPVEIALIESAESSGHVHTLCLALSDRLTQAAEVRDGIVQSLAYPVFVLISSCLLAPVPLLFTQGTGPFFWAAAQQLLIVGVVLAVVLGVIPQYLAQPAARARVLGLAGRLPLLKIAMAHRRLALVLSVLARAMDAGIPLPQALRAAGKSSGEADVALALETARHGLAQGQSLSQALVALPGMRQTGLALIAAAQRTGNLPEALQEQADTWQKAWTRDLQIGGKVVRFGLSLLVLIWVAFGVVEQFTKVLTDPLSMVPGKEGEDLRKELNRGLKQAPNAPTMEDLKNL